MLILSYFIYFDQGRHSCPGASCNFIFIYWYLWNVIYIAINWKAKWLKGNARKCSSWGNETMSSDKAIKSIVFVLKESPLQYFPKKFEFAFGMRLVRLLEWSGQCLCGIAVIYYFVFKCPMFSHIFIHSSKNCVLEETMFPYYLEGLSICVLECSSSAC